MKKHFYSHLISEKDIHEKLEVLDITTAEKNHLFVIIESSLHHVVVDAVLSELSEDKKHVFLSHVVAENNDGVWGVLRTSIQDPEKKILSAVEKLQQELIADIQEVSKNF